MNTIIIFLASYLYLFVVAIGILVFIKETLAKHFSFLITAFIALPLSYVLAKLLSLIILSPRPFFTDHVQPLIPVATDNGFPSDHTLLAVTVALLVLTVNKKWGVFLLILAGGVGVGRLLAHAHHPIDILGSFAIATIATITGVIVSRRFSHSSQKQKGMIKGRYL